MMRNLWALTVGVLGAAAPLQAQPVSPPEAAATGPSMTVAELEEKIGGRTTLELKFEDATREQVLEALRRSSGLRFSSDWDPLPGVPRASLAAMASSEEPRFDADVARADFWTALRAWSQAGRLQQTRASGERPRLRSGVGLGVSFDESRRLWSLAPDSSALAGRTQSSWPCFIVAKSLKRAQGLILSDDNPAPTTNAPATTGAAAEADAQSKVVVIGAGGVSEPVEGGHLSDSLSVSLSVFLEPKLLPHAEVRLQAREALDDQGQDMLAEKEKTDVPRGGVTMSNSSFSNGVLKREIQLKPRLSKGTRLARLSGVIQIRFPLQVQQHEITDFSNPLQVPVTIGVTQGKVQIEAPSLQNGHWIFEASASAKPDQGWRRILNGQRPRDNMVLGAALLPPLSRFTFTDAQGRTWRPVSMSSGRGFSGSDGKGLPVTSPPTPVPDNFSYHEEMLSVLFPVDPERAASSLNSTRTLDNLELEYITAASKDGRRRSSGLHVAPWPTLKLKPQELDQVKFTKATFATESDWRTLEVPFEFRDLPLPPR